MPPSSSPHARPSRRPSLALEQLAAVVDIIVTLHVRPFLHALLALAREHLDTPARRRRRRRRRCGRRGGLGGGGAASPPSATAVVAAAGGTSAAATAAWHSEQVLALSLVRRLCIALRDEFEPQLPSLVPLLLGLSARRRVGRPPPHLAALKTLETFGQLLDAHEYAVIPALLG